MLASQLGASAALPGALPISAAKAGATYALFGLPVLGAAAAVAQVSNQIVYTPIFVPFTIKVSQLGIFGSNANYMRLGLYAVGSDGLPGALIYDTGQLTGTMSQTASSPPILSRGWYYLATISNQTSTSILGYAPSNVPSLLHAGLLPIAAGASTSPVSLNATTGSYSSAFPSLAAPPTSSFASLQIAQMVAA